MTKTDYYIPLYKNGIYHIYNRGNGNEKLFYEKENYYYFLRQYDKFISELVDTFAFCLLPNHFHLLVRIKHANPEIITETFRKFFISYSMSVNKQQQRRGSLFKRGFKRKLIEDEKYLYAVVYYIQANPVHHGLVDNLTNYNYSSYGILAGEKETKLKKKTVIDWFGSKEKFIDFHTKSTIKKIDDNFIIEDE